MNRAYAVLELKAVADGTKRTFSGIATTPATDRMGDIVEPKGAKFKLPIPLLWQHDSRQPIGWVTRAKVTPRGIEIEGEVADIPEDGALKSRLLEAWQSIKSTLVRGLSIGFTPLEMEAIDAKQPWGAQRFVKWEWLELSAVTIPANADASISAIKSIDHRLLAASGNRQKTVIPPALGRTGSNPPNSKGKSMKTYTQETLTKLREDREAKAKRMEELIETKAGQDNKFSDEQRAEFNTLDADIENLDDEITVTQRHVTNIAKAVPVDTGRGGGYRGVKKFTDQEARFKGEEGVKRFVATTIATLDAKKGLFRNPSQVAEAMWGKTNPTLVAVMKANEVAGGGTDSGEWGAELAQVDTTYTGDFISYLYGLTVFDRLPLRAVPHNVAIKGQDGAFTGYWVGQSKPIPMSKGDYSTTSTAALKVAGLTVISNELIRDSSPAALGLVGDGLREAVAQIVDTTFFSASAASAGVSPAGILNGLSAIASNGGDAQSISTDIKALFAPFVTAKNMSGGFVFVMTPTTAIALSLMKNALGQTEYPTINGNGGTFLGYPVFVGDNVGTGDVILLKPSDIWKIGDLGVSLSVSTEAMIEQSSAPTGATDTPVAASQAFTSMFQEESTAIKVVRPINWGKKYASAVAYVGDAAWGTEAS